ncbi:hypothetical protein OAL44_00410 [Planctomycetaceae bacterium]|nr:hypothetical protein [bacterium]MDC0307576.1 hypothetical protein [Planctomycetaceae bacterium]
MLHSYPIVLCGPEGLNIELYREILGEIRWESFATEHFSSIENYSRLLLNPHFHERFREHQFMLLYQTDAFIFRDELNKWCDTDYDYMGAPFLKNDAKDTHNLQNWVGGNGGFSLRRIDACLDILTRCRRHRMKSTSELWTEYRRTKGLLSPRALLGFLVRSLGVNNTLGHLIDHYPWNEDAFWSMEAPKTGCFRVPSPEESAQLSLETHPRFWIEQLEGHLPMGCHAWWRYDLEFWKTHLQEAGYDINGKVSLS